MPDQQPPPVNDEMGSIAWKDWLFKFQAEYNALNHNDLNNIQGGSETQRYHLTQLQWEQSRSWRNLAPIVPVTLDTLKTTPDVILSTDLLTVDLADGLAIQSWEASGATQVMPAGNKLYWELYFRKVEDKPDNGPGLFQIGMADATFPWLDNVAGLGRCNAVGNPACGTAEHWGWDNGLLYHNSTQLGVTTGVGSWNFNLTGETLQFAVDVNAGDFWIGKNNTWAFSGDPATGTNPTNKSTTVTASYTGLCFPGITINGRLTVDNREWTFHFADADFTYTPPTGFTAIPTARTISEDTFLIPAVGGDTYDLPTGSTWDGRLLAVKKTDDTGIVTVNASGLDTIDGAASLTITNPKEAVVLQLRGTTWDIIADYLDSDISFADATNFSKRYTLLLS